MDTEFVYRDAPVAGDVQAIGAMVADTGFFRPDEVAVAMELVEERLAKGERSGYYFWFVDCYAKPEQPVAYVCFGPTPCTIGSFDLYWIVTDKDWQGKGLGKKLASLAERTAAAMGGKRMYVETAGKEQYGSTRAFYESAGYFKAAELPDFYDVGDAKLIYQKDL